jgi:hypothetical protein
MKRLPPIPHDFRERFPTLAAATDVRVADLTLRESWRIAWRTVGFVVIIVGLVWGMSLVSSRLGNVYATWNVPKSISWAVVVFIVFVIAPRTTSQTLAFWAEGLLAVRSWLLRLSVGRRVAMFAGFVALLICYQYAPIVAGVVVLVIIAAVHEFQEVVKFRFWLGTEPPPIRLTPAYKALALQQDMRMAKTPITPEFLASARQQFAELLACQHNMTKAAAGATIERDHLASDEQMAELQDELNALQQRAEADLRAD